MTNPRTIELTEHEVNAEELFHTLLDEGAGIKEAVDKVRARYRRSCRALFYRWLLAGRAQ